MDNTQKKFFLFSGIALAVGVTIFALTRGGGDETPTAKSPEEKTTNNQSRYEERIAAAREAEKQTQFTTIRHSGIEADSLLVNNKVIANPVKVEKQRQEAEFKNRVNRAYDQGQSSIEQLQYATKGKKNDDIIYYHGKSYQKATTEPQQVIVESDKERRKRAIEESLNNRAIMNEAMISAVVHTTQVVGDGQMVMFRTTKEFPAQGLTIPKNTIFYAKLRFSRNRALVNVESIKVNKDFYALVLKGHGEDGNEGIPVNIDSEKKEIDSEIKDIAVDQAANVMNYAGTPGRILSSITKGVSRAAESGSRQTRKIKLIDNQKVNFVIQN